MQHLYLLLLLLLSSSLFAQQAQKSNQQINQLLKKDQWTEAISLLEQSLETNKANDFLGDSLRINFIGKLVECYEKTTQVDRAYKQAVYYLNEAKFIPREFVLANLAMGDILIVKGDYSNALTFYLQAKESWIASFDQEHETYATILVDIALAHEYNGAYKLAFANYEQAKQLRIRLGKTNRQNYATLLNNYAVAHYYAGNYDKALTLYEEATALRKKLLGAQHSDYTSSLNNLAVLHQLMGNYELSIPLYEEVLEIIAQTEGEQSLNYAMSLSNRAAVEAELKNYAKAERYYIQSLAIRKQQQGDAHPEYCLSAVNLARLYQLIDKHAEALDLLLHCKQQYKNQGKEDLHNYHTVLLQEARSRRHQGAYQQAGSLLQDYLVRVYKKKQSKEHIDYLHGVNDLFVVYTASKDWTKAYAQAEAFASILLGKTITVDFSTQCFDDLRGEIRGFEVQGDLWLSFLGHCDELLQQDPTIIERKTKRRQLLELKQLFIDKQIKRIYGEKDQLRYLQQKGETLTNYINLLPPSAGSKALQFAEENKSVLLSTSLENTVNRLLPDSILEQKKALEKQLAAYQAKYDAALNQVEKKKYRGLLNKANREQVDLRNQLQKDYPFYNNQATSLFSVDILQENLEEQSLLIEYLLMDSVLHAFVVTKHKLQWHRLPCVKKDLESRLRAYRRGISDYKTLSKLKDFSNQSHALYQQLLDPILKEQENIKRLIIIPDADLAYLPFETLVTQQEEQMNFGALAYLIKKYSISYNSSAQLWLHSRKQQPNQATKGMLGVAASYAQLSEENNRFTQRGREVFLRSQLSPLPEAQKEVELLESRYIGNFYYGESASERQVKKELQNYQILHFALHGVLNEEHPDLSSLVLTDTKDSVENDFLQAYEIASMELQADLAVLSACETGIGRFEQGNGLASLARSFMYARVPSLVVSLWQVNDYSTAQLMQAYYANLAKGMQKDDALREAKLNYLDEVEDLAQHPAFWAPFVQMGNLDEINIKEKDSRRNSYSLLLIGLLLIIFLVYWKKK